MPVCGRKERKQAKLYTVDQSDLQVIPAFGELIRI